MVRLPLKLELPPDLARVLRDTPGLERACLVGGCVRDALSGLPVKDWDVEVYGMDYDRLVGALSRWGKTDLVGRSFGVVKLRTREATYDFTLPRVDSKTGPGHKGFAVDARPEITPAEAAARRDFTVNALMWDPRSGEVVDFFGGLRDLADRILRHTSPAFPEDPLRVLRGMQFASRFRLSPAPETVELCRSIVETHAELAVERIREEWFKWAEKSVVPSIGLHFLAQTGWIRHYPELEALQGTPQEPRWHPEGDVFVHTCHCCDALAGLPAWQSADPETRIVYMLAVLTHDFGKPATTHARVKEGESRIVSPGHDEAGGPLAEQFLERIQVPVALRRRVLPLVLNHMAHLSEFTDRAVRRLARRLEPETIESLCVVMTADAMGRPPKPPEAPAIVHELRRRASELQVQDGAPEPLLLGRHLLPLGFTPGPELGACLRAAYEAQLEGQFSTTEEALAWVRSRWPRQGTHEGGGAAAS